MEPFQHVKPMLFIPISAGANFLIVTQGHLTMAILEPLIIGLITLVIVAMSVQRLKEKFLT